MEHVVGFLSMGLSIAIALIGLPAQIVKNHKEKHVGIARWMIVLVLSSYLARMVYGFLIGSYYIVIPDCFGTFFSSVLLYQALLCPRLAVIEYLEAKGWVKMPQKPLS